MSTFLGTGKERQLPVSITVLPSPCSLSRPLTEEERRTRRARFSSQKTFVGMLASPPSPSFCGAVAASSTRAVVAASLSCLVLPTPCRRACPCFVRVLGERGGGVCGFGWVGSPLRRESHLCLAMHTSLHRLVRAMNPSPHFPYSFLSFLPPRARSHLRKLGDFGR
ncbi:hypothetical protein CBR_g247 [Chara braunii]|uniref:Uncharacterized protein n=1 Tax=Chara braunii TaxID=69332 RepID=A0A388JM19_CHABU|nr:hypothetical protein CBR_g247 [Chara braunii]|eukprot:GBG58848.1 hypothetical protein CBR_g247 [Chara braunii]